MTLTSALWFLIIVTMKVRNQELFRLHADFCKMLSNPKRLMILAVLSKGEMSVGEIADSIDTALPTVSQHLTVLRSKHVVAARKEGQTVYYRATDPRLMEASVLIRLVLLDGMKRRGEIAREIEVDPVGVTR